MGDVVTAQFMLPAANDASHEVKTWVLPLDDADLTQTVTVRGKFIGMSSSRRNRHGSHIADDPSREYAEPGERCGACRWFEPRIFRETDEPQRYLIFRVGQSIVPGEVPFYACQWVNSAPAVIAMLTTRRRNWRTGEREAFLSDSVDLVLAQSTRYDDDMYDAYADRAVI